MIFGDYDKDELLDKFRYFGFTSLLSRLVDLVDSDDTEHVEEKIEILKLKDIEKFIDEVNKKGQVILKTVRGQGNILRKKYNIYFYKCRWRKNILCRFK